MLFCFLEAPNNKVWTFLNVFKSVGVAKVITTYFVNKWPRFIVLRVKSEVVIMLAA